MSCRDVLRRCLLRGDRELEAPLVASLAVRGGASAANGGLEDIFKACNFLRQLNLSPEAEVLVANIEENAEALKGEMGEKARTTAPLGLPCAVPPFAWQQARWLEAFSSGGCLWQVMNCIQDLRDEWVIGSLYIGDGGLYFEGGDNDDHCHQEFMPWHKIEKLGMANDFSDEAHKKVVVSRTAPEDPVPLIMVTPSDASWLLQAWEKAPKERKEKTPEEQEQQQERQKRSGTYSLTEAVIPARSTTYSLTQAALQLPPQTRPADAEKVSDHHLPELTLEQVKAAYQAEPFIHEQLLHGDPFNCTDFKTTRWIDGVGVPGSLVRRVRFRKPLSSMQAAFSGGVKSADCTAVFRMKCTENYIDILQKTTTEGPPYTDCFWVEIRMIFKDIPDGGVSFQVFTKVVWSKKPWVPGIQKTVAASATDESKASASALLRCLKAGM